MTRLPLCLVLLFGAHPLPVVAQTLAPNEGCELCHGEVELLRQHTESLAEARRMVATGAQVDGSAHGGMRCQSCHSGFERFPHEGQRQTESCDACHQEERESWHRGIHAEPDQQGAPRTPCTACHGTHDVLSRTDMARGDGLQAINGRCVACHETRSLPPEDPHADTVACGHCHASHATRDVDDPLSRMAPHAQAATCGACHQEMAAAYEEDVHGAALATLGTVGGAELALREDAPPSCVACHRGHDIRAPVHEGFNRDMVQACEGCHQDYAASYYGTYHGKATALGSEIVATCDQCHGSHEVYAASDPRSLVSQTNLVETCGACHDHARPAFVRYDSHPDPMDRGRNMPLFLSFVFMNTVLVGVLVVFGLHTLLWWIRLWMDQRKGIEHGVGIDHE